MNQIINILLDSFWSWWTFISYTSIKFMKRLCTAFYNEKQKKILTISKSILNVTARSLYLLSMTLLLIYLWTQTLHYSRATLFTKTRFFSWLLYFRKLSFPWNILSYALMSTFWFTLPLLVIFAIYQNPVLNSPPSGGLPVLTYTIFHQFSMLLWKNCPTGFIWVPYRAISKVPWRCYYSFSYRQGHSRGIKYT